MTSDRLQLPFGRMVPDFLRHNQLVVELMALFRAMSHQGPTSDTSIGWEDGEVEREPPVDVDA